MIFKPFEIFKETTNDLIAVIKLNSKFENRKDIDMFTRIWKKGVIRAAVDGGANILHKYILSSHSLFPPTFISGDFDSTSGDILQLFKNQGSEIIHTPDQNQSDFTKCLKLLLKRIESQHIHVDYIVAHIGNSHNRLDHTFGNVNTLYLSRCLTNIPIYLILSDSISFLLNKGSNTIASKSPFRGNWCSLVPIGKSCHNVITSGLKYNLNDETMEFGGMVSTSNAFDETQEYINVDTNEPLLCSLSYQL